MEWDLGVRGLALLLAMSFGFGIFVQFVLWKLSPHSLWLIATATYFAAGLFVSEFWFGWATEEDLQPNVDGLSFDEVLLLAPLVATLVLLVVWLVTRRARRHRTA